MESDLRLSIEARSGARSAGESARRFGGAFANPEILMDVDLRDAQL